MVAPVTRESLLWGLISALAFLVMIQGYELLASEAVTITVKAGVAVFVAVLTAVSTYFTRRRALGGTPE